MKTKLIAVICSTIFVISACGNDSGGTPLVTITEKASSSVTTTTSTTAPEVSTSQNTRSQAFLRTLKTSKHSSIYAASSDSTHLNIGETSCNMLDDGSSIADLQQIVVKATQDSTLSASEKQKYFEAVSYRLGAAVGALCPEHLNKISR